MKISEAQLAEFMRLYEKRFGKPIDRQDALYQAQMLLRLVERLQEYNRGKRYKEYMPPALDRLDIDSRIQKLIN